ncbi:hypothetical protein CHUAL_009189 [Chamberlinius hualienensis]
MTSEPSSSSPVDALKLNPASAKPFASLQGVNFSTSQLRRVQHQSVVSICVLFTHSKKKKVNMSLALNSIVFFAVVVALTVAFPTFHNGRQHHVKLDPFVALAQTLRQEDLQQQQQRRPIHHPFPQSEADYEEDGQRSDEDDQQQPIDQWQIRQLQRQFGQAAMMMPLFQREQRNWEFDDQPEDYGVPIMSREDEEVEDDSQFYPGNGQIYESNGQLYPVNGQLYQDNRQLYQSEEEPVYSYYPKQNDNNNNGNINEEDEEKRLLMDTLFQYMSLAGSSDNEQSQKDNVKRSGSQKEEEKSVKSSGQKESGFVPDLCFLIGGYFTQLDRCSGCAWVSREEK